MKENKCRVLFFDGKDKSTGKYISLEKAFTEDYVRIVGNEIVPTDECAILEQYTGLKDSTKWENLKEAERTDWTRSGKLPSEWKGKEIYEGDIVRICGIEFVVKIDEYFNGKRYAYGVYFYDIELGLIDGCIDISEDKEIIGTIHQNPELLED